MLKKYRFKSQGFTMIELMIGLLISSILVGSAIFMLSSVIRNNQNTMHSIKLNQELQGVLVLMSNDIRRAGYWANAEKDVHQNMNTNPFMKNDTDVTINADKNCILLSYDHNSDGVLPALNTANNDERYGYRLLGSAIQTRPSTAGLLCTASANSWENLTDTNTVVITGLTFAQTNSAIDLDGSDPGTASMLIRNIDITVSGYHVARPNLTKTLSYRVRLRNDKFIQ